MNVNDLICVGAEPLALLDYVAVERADAELLRALGEGLRAGAELAGVEIPGGEVCQLPEVIRGHPSPHGFDLVGSAFGTVALDQIIDGSACRPGDALIGLPASGVHSNGLTLARRALGGARRSTRTPDELGGASVAERAARADGDLRARDPRAVAQRGRRSTGWRTSPAAACSNLLRIGSGVGYEISSPLPLPPIFELIASRGGVALAEMWEVFNMGCGFCAMVSADRVDAAVRIAVAPSPGTAVIGQLTAEQGVVALPGLGLEGDADGLRPQRG